MPGFFGHIKFLRTTFKGRHRTLVSGAISQSYFPHHKSVASRRAEHGTWKTTSLFGWGHTEMTPFLEPENDLMENKQLQLKWWLSEISSFSGLLVTSSAFPGEVENVRDVICWETNQSACPGKAWKPAFQVDKPWGLFSCFNPAPPGRASNPINNGLFSISTGAGV